MKSQTDKILTWLRRRPITTMQAFRDLGCTRLAAHIRELREMGYDIEAERVSRNGKTFARYRLVGE